jgi:PKHD-type hydroxylase
MNIENLLLPEVDLSEPPEYNMKHYTHWNLFNMDNTGLYSIENLFTLNECREIIKIGRSFKIDESKLGSGQGFSDIRKSYNSWISPNEISNWIYLKLQNAIENANKNFGFDLHSVESLQFTKYEDSSNGFYKIHCDQHVNTSLPNSHRKLSFSVQLTDPNLYSGGDLAIYEQGSTPIFAPKSIGTISFFPSYMLHEVTPVTQGIRYSLVSWIHGPKFK